MEITLVYAIALGGVLLIPLLINLLPWLPYLTFSTPPFLQQILRYLKYAYLVRRHQFLGPWTFADILLQVIYIASNSVCLCLPDLHIAKAGMRAGNLSLINMIPLFLGPHLGFLADILGVSLSTFRLMHRSAGVMSCSLVLFHVLAMLVSHTVFPLRGTANLSAVVWSIPLFLGPHLGFLADILGVSLSTFRLMHRSAGVMSCSLVLFHVLAMLVSHTVFPLRGTANLSAVVWSKLPRVGEVFKYPGEDDNSPVQLTIIPQEPLRMGAGQYVNIYIPSLGVRSFIFMQTHPFVVASWTGKRQTKLELVIEPRRGWTKILQSRAITASGQSGGLGRVLFTGPHGAIVPVSNYEYIFMVASGYGIIAQLPLLERLVQGTLAREVRARRICLVWEFEDIGLYKAVYPLFNWVLVEDRKLGDNCALAISLYSSQLAPDELSKRAKISPESLSLKDVFKAEIAEIDKRKTQENEAVRKMEEKRAKEIERGREEVVLERPVGEIIHEPGALPVCTSTPRMLITVSASTKIRDELRSILRTSLDKDITLKELDYQPSD
ncbi:uncharacterized protein PAC_02008 [Phialocephala subalpina]|uniref:FAD-binding FR-type domain-containing protein n=1 Tax=Phialocephala subalpina TaxID=576137 RepID=A0A1L7WH72_9HELO|nr:uncharacterized protein PAC_02008 [Phialocephala subalpina]